jgi:hypothetical protein
VAWENAKARAADLGITQSTLYPTVAAAVLADSHRLACSLAPALLLAANFQFAFTLTSGRPPLGIKMLMRALAHTEPVGPSTAACSFTTTCR